MKKTRAKRAKAVRARKSRRARKNKRGVNEAPRKLPDRSAISARGVHLSIQQAAEEFGHDWTTIRKRLRELGIDADGERHGHPVYRLRDLLKLERMIGAGEVDPDKLTPFERQAHFKAESERLRVGVERGELVRRENVEEEWARVLRLLAHRCDVMMDEIERDVGAPAAVLEAIGQKLDAMREGFYADTVDGEQPGDPQEPAAVPEPARDLPRHRGDHPPAEADPA